MITYKVVEKGTRFGSNWMFLKQEFENEDFRQLCNDIRKENPEYFPRYLNNTVVNKAPKSVGILCFSSKHFAEQFIQPYSDFNLSTKIIKVRGIGKKTYTNDMILISGCGESPERLTTRKPDMAAHEGTIAFDAVEVLE